MPFAYSNQVCSPCGYSYLSAQCPRTNVRVADGTERQIIKDMDGHTPRAKIKACSILDPYVLVFREDDSIGMFIGEPGRGKIRRKDMSPMGEKVILSGVIHSVVLLTSICRAPAI